MCLWSDVNSRLSAIKLNAGERARTYLIRGDCSAPPTPGPGLRTATLLVHILNPRRNVRVQGYYSQAATCVSAW